MRRANSDSKCCFARRLSRKAVCEKAQRRRGNACQSCRPGRPRDGWTACDERDGRFRSPPLEPIQRPREGFVRQPPRQATAARSAALRWAPAMAAISCGGCSPLGVYQASTLGHNPGKSRASVAFAISASSRTFVCWSRRAPPLLRGPCTTHNREVGGSNPPGATPTKPCSRWAFASQTASASSRT